MAHYKDLNKELVEQVQAMRISLQEHREEIISLRAKCMHKHENIVFLRKKCKDFAVLHCQQYLEFLEPDSTILSTLQGVSEEATLTPVQRLQNIVGNGNVRQSARLTVECRRSSSLTQTRRSFNSTSPIRSSSWTEVEIVEDNAFESELESSAVTLGNAIQEEDEEYEDNDDVDEDDGNTVEETCNTLGITNTLCHTEACNGKTGSNTSHKAANEDDAVDRRTRTFRDITNTLCPTNASHKTTTQETATNSYEHKTRRKGCASVSHNKATKSGIAEDENEDPNIASPTVSSSPVRKPNHVTISRGKCKNKKHSDKQCSPVDNEREINHKNKSEHQILLTNLRAARFADSDESLLQDSNTEASRQESIQEARHVTTKKQQNVESFYTTGEEVTASSYALSEITLAQFKEATSSTPIQQQRNTMPPSTTSSTPGHSSRPKRSCKPKSMVEPSLNAKMRNDSGEKSLTCKSKQHKKHKSLK